MKDYTSETTSYLKSIGREDAIEKVIPKTREQYILERAKKDLLIEDLAKNMTTLMDQYKNLRGEVDALKQAKLN